MNRGLFVAGVGTAVLISVGGCRHPAASEEAILVRVSDWTVPAVAQRGSPLQITLQVESGGCARFKRVEILRSESQVVIRAWGTSPSPIKGVGVMLMCPQTFPQTEVVQLDPPFVQSFTIVVEEPYAWPDLSATVTVQ
jgi:hypothetical protein